MSAIDDLLVAQLKSHNQEAFRRLFDLYRNDIYGYSLGLLKKNDLAEENVQEVFLKVWLHRETLDPSKSFKSYIFTIARNQAFNMLSKASYETKLREEIFFESQQSYEDTDYRVRLEQCEDIERQALDNLSEKRRLIFNMSRQDGKSYEEISQELGISISTVKNQMSKALESLRVFFSTHDEVFILLLYIAVFARF